MDKTTIIGCAVGVAVTVGAIIGLSIWGTRNQWDQDVADAEIIELTDIYNAAIHEFPADVNRAIFWFDVEVAKKRDAFLAKNNQHEEHVVWLARFEAQCVHLRKALRKG